MKLVLCIFFCSFLLGPLICLSILFLGTLKLCFFPLNVKDQYSNSQSKQQVELSYCNLQQRKPKYVEKD